MRGRVNREMQRIQMQVDDLLSRHASEQEALESQLRSPGIAPQAAAQLQSDLEALRQRHTTEWEAFQGKLASVTAGAGAGAVAKVAASPFAGAGLRIALGGLSAVLAQGVVHPIETTKVRLQNESGTAKKYHNLFRGARVILQEEGLCNPVHPTLCSPPPPPSTATLLHSSATQP